MSDKNKIDIEKRAEELVDQHIGWGILPSVIVAVGEALVDELQYIHDALINLKTG